MTERMTADHEQILKNWPGPTVYMNHIRTLLTEIHALRRERDELAASDEGAFIKKDLEFFKDALKKSEADLAKTGNELVQSEKDRAEYQAAFEEAHQLMMDMEGKWLRG